MAVDELSARWKVHRIWNRSIKHFCWLGTKAGVVVAVSFKVI